VTEAERRAALEAIAAEVRACTRCPLHEGRTNSVPGEGHPSTEVVLVGEGPGFNEDRQGRPFVGRAGELLVRLLARADPHPALFASYARTLRELVPQVRTFGTFNFLLSNGEALWAHCSTRLYWLVRQHPFTRATLMDEDWTVNFAEINQPGDRAAVIVTCPLTRDEQWTAFEPDELRLFVDGLPVPDEERGR